MRRTIFSVLMVLAVFAGNMRGQENTNSVSDEKNTKAFHLEVFTFPLFVFDKEFVVDDGTLSIISGILLNRTLMEGSSRISMTLPLVDVVFATGGKQWEKHTFCRIEEVIKTATDNGENPLLQHKKPGWVFSGFGLGLVTGEGNGILQLRLPIVGRRLVRNFWLTTGVGVMPFAKENHFGFTFGIQSWVPPSR